MFDTGTSRFVWQIGRLGEYFFRDFIPREINSAMVMIHIQ